MLTDRPFYHEITVCNARVGHEETSCLKGSGAWGQWSVGEDSLDKLEKLIKHLQS